MTKKLYVLIYLVGAAASVVEAEVNFCHFTTKDHPKANGISMQISYPSDWKREEGKRPHIVQRFFSSSNTVYLSQVALTITEIRKEALDCSESELQEMFIGQEAVTATITSLSGRRLSYKKTKLDGVPAAAYTYVAEHERAGVRLTLYSHCFQFVHKNNLVQVTLSVSPKESISETELSRIGESKGTLFTQIGNSIILNDKWTQSGQGVDLGHLDVQVLNIVGGLSINLPHGFSFKTVDNYTEVLNNEGLPVIFISALHLNDSTPKWLEVMPDKVDAASRFMLEQKERESVKTKQLSGVGLNSQIAKWNPPYPLIHLKTPAFGIDYIRKDDGYAMGRRFENQSYCVNIQIVNDSFLYNVNMKHLVPANSKTALELPSDLVQIIKSISLKGNVSQPNQ